MVDASTVVEANAIGNDLVFFPNPAIQQVTVFLRAESSLTGVLDVFDSSYSLLMHQSVNVQKGNNSFVLSTYALAPGIYLLRYYSGSHSECAKLVVE